MRRLLSIPVDWDDDNSQSKRVFKPIFKHERFESTGTCQRLFICKLIIGGALKMQAHVMPKAKNTFDDIGSLTGEYIIVVGS